MNKRILILTGEVSKAKGIFTWQHIGSLKDINDVIFETAIEKEFVYLLCILEVPASVREIQCFTESVKKFYSLPICVFEKNIIENYPGEKWEIKEMVDILIKRSFTQKDFFLLIDRVLDLAGQKEPVSIEKMLKQLERMGSLGYILIKENYILMRIESILQEKNSIFSITYFRKKEM